MKSCTKCGKEKELTEFYRRAAAKDGLQNNCKPCCGKASTRASRKWRKLNPKAMQGYVNQHRYHTPTWADRAAIRKFYEDRPEGMHVDHIIPHNGTAVTGLHVLANLQYLTPTQNKSKGNTWQSNS
jgi:hypothetical protein